MLNGTREKLREIKQYAALEIPLPMNKFKLLQVHQQISHQNNDSKRYTFTRNKPWIIHGPEKASRITFRGKTMEELFKISKDFKQG